MKLKLLYKHFSSVLLFLFCTIALTFYSRPIQAEKEMPPTDARAYLIFCVEEIRSKIRDLLDLKELKSSKRGTLEESRIRAHQKAILLADKSLPIGADSLRIAIPNFKKELKSEAQHYFLQQMWLGVIRTQILLNEKPTVLLSDLLEQLSQVRSQIEWNLNGHNFEGFGKARIGFAETPITDHNSYSVYFNRAKSLLHQKQTPSGFFREKNIFFGKSIYQRERINHTWISLTGLAEKSIFFSKAGEDQVILLHPQHKEIASILSHCEHLFHGLKNKDLPPIQIFEKTAELHWWLAQAMPYNRGSAAIADATAKSILLYHGFWGMKWKPGILPDLEAVLRRRRNFMKEYINFFEFKVPENL